MENHTLTVKSAETLNVPVTASCYAIKAAYRNALALAEKSVPLVSLAYDWLAVRSELQRKVDLEKYEAANYHTLAEVIEMRICRWHSGHSGKPTVFQPTIQYFLVAV